MHIDEIRTDGATSSTIFSEMINSYRKNRAIISLSLWLMNLLGQVCLFKPLIREDSCFPQVGMFISRFFSANVYIFGLVWTTALHFFLMGIASVFYRPCFGIFCFAVFGVFL